MRYNTPTEAAKAPFGVAKQRRTSRPLEPGRGDRFNPTLTHTRYAILRRLKEALELVIEDVSPPHRNAILIDYGCGNMPYRPLFEKAGVSYLGADLPGNELADVVIGDHGGLLRADGTCDIVLSTQVLEHVPDPSRYLEEAYRVLRSGGHLLLTTHGYWIHHPDPTDFWRWTGQGLLKLVTSVRFEIVQCRGILGLGPAGIQLLQDAILRKTPRWMHGAIGFLMNQGMLFLDRIHSDSERERDAIVFLVVGRKC